jgi:hypothetical protein
MVHVFSSLVFRGSVASGLAYLEVLEVLGQKSLMDNNERVGGTSVCALGFPAYADKQDLISFMCAS